MTSRAKNPGLLGVLLGGAVASFSLINSGCVPLATLIAADHQAVINARAMRDAALINARANGYQNSNVQNNSPSWEYFTCSDWKDFNGDGMLNPKSIPEGGEVIDKGRTEFYVGDKGMYALILRNCKGKKLEIFFQKTPGAEFTIKNKIVDKDESIYCPSFILEEPASWHAYYALDGAKIAEYRINVKEDPARRAIKN